MSHTLLLADDSETTHRVVALMFAERGIRVVGVTDGQQAVERLSAEAPDIVLAGVSLAKVDGYQLADFMRGQPQLRNVPILLLSGAFDTVDEERVRQSGASGVLVKPFESELVINRVKELLGFGGKTDRPATAPGGRLFPQDLAPHRPSLTGPRGAGAPAPRPAVPASTRPDPPPHQATRHDTGPPYGGPGNQASRPDHHQNHAAGGAAPPSARHDTPPSYGGASHEGHVPQQPAAWDQLREQSGLGRDAAHVEPGNAGGSDDYFDRLDAAFDNLDAQLSGRSSSSSTRDTAPTTRRLPVQDDIPTRRLPPTPSRHEPEEPQRAEPESAHEDHQEWFAGEQAPASAGYEPAAFARPHVDRAHGGPSAANHAHPAAARHDDPASYGAAPPPPYGPPVYTPPPANYAPVAPVHPPSLAPAPPASFGVAGRTEPVASASARPESLASYGETSPQRPAIQGRGGGPVPPSFADAFDHLLAAEQGEAQSAADAHAHGPVIEISDDVIERIASRVAERLSEGVLIDTVTHIVTAVSERLVREEITRIRAAAQAKKI